MSRAEMSEKAHWEAIHRAKRPDELSWFQREARTSLALIRRVAPPTASAIIDVGGGASRLVDGLLAVGYQDVTVLDISAVALGEARDRLGSAAAVASWSEADILEADLPLSAFDLWHDRALFHFLTAAGDRARYIEQVRRVLRPAGHLVVATFAEDGPTRCSGLPVVRYSPRQLQAEFGSQFRLLDSVREEHITPSGVSQSFVYCLLQLAPTVS